VIGVGIVYGLSQLGRCCQQVEPISTVTTAKTDQTGQTVLKIPPTPLQTSPASPAINPYFERIPLDAEIVIIQREAGFTPDGTLIPADTEPVECVVLKGTDGLHFGLKVVSPECKQYNVIIAKRNGVDTEVCVAREEFENRFLLTYLTDDIWVGKGLQKELREKDYLSILANYQRLLEKRQKAQSSEPTSPELLLKLVKKAFWMRRIEQGRQSDPKLCGVSITLPKEGSAYGFFKGDKLSLYDNKNEVKMNGGSEGVISQISAIPHGKAKVVKTYITGSVLNFSVVIREYKLVDSLHEGFQDPTGKQRVPGIQKRFEGFCFKKLFMKKYEGNLREAILVSSPFQSLDEKLEAFYRLIVGLHYCFTKKGLIHGDTKLLNLLCFTDKNTGKLLIDLADFGSAELLDPNQVTFPLGFPRTDEYSLENDKSESKKLTEKLHFSYSKDDYKQYRVLAHKMDIFGLGRVFGQLLLDLRYNLDKMGKWNPVPDSFQRAVLEKDGIPAPLCDLIENMICGNTEKRFDSQQCINALEAILKARGLQSVVDTYAYVLKQASESS
jgi:hypothetical protein